MSCFAFALPASLLAPPASFVFLSCRLSFELVAFHRAVRWLLLLFFLSQPAVPSGEFSLSTAAPPLPASSAASSAFFRILTIEFSRQK